MPILIINTKRHMSIEAEMKLLDSINTSEIKDIWVAVPATRLMYYKHLYASTTIIAQHIDVFDTINTSRVGYIDSDQLTDIGINTALYNHSAHPSMIPLQLPEHINTIYCVPDMSTIDALYEHSITPFAIAYEPPELIGSSTASVMDMGIDALLEVKQRCKSSHFIVGAGVSKPSECALVKDIGAFGVLIASSITKADDAFRKTMELYTALKG